MTRMKLLLQIAAVLFILCMAVGAVSATNTVKDTWVTSTGTTYAGNNASISVDVDTSTNVYNKTVAAANLVYFSTFNSTAGTVNTVTYTQNGATVSFYLPEYAGSNVSIKASPGVGTQVNTPYLSADFGKGDKQYYLPLNPLPIVEASSKTPYSLSASLYYYNYTGSLLGPVSVTVDPSSVTVQKTTVTFNKNATVSEEKINWYNSSFNESESSLSGYTFNEWNVTFDGGQTWEPLYQEKYVKDGVWMYTNTTVDEPNLTVWGNYTAHTYNVTFNNNTGSGIMNNQTFTYDVSQALTGNTFTKLGYSFAGWATTAAGEVVYTDGQVVQNLTADDNGVVDLYANWTLNSTTSNPDASGNAVFGNDNITALKSTEGIVTKVLLDEVSNVSAGAAVTFKADNTTLGVPQLDGYDLGEDIAVFEINASADGTATINVTVTFKDADTATAYMDKIEFVHFNTTNNAWDKNPLTIVNKVNDNAGKVTYTVETDSFSPFGIGIYTAHTYTVTFDANGGQGSMADMSFTYNKAQNLNANTFQRYNSNFVGWLYNGTRYDDKALVNNLTTEDGGSVTMVAQWETYSTGGSSSGTSYLGSSDVSVISTQQPTVAPTVAPTEQPATPTVIATEKPTTQATQSSPAPFVGVLAGLGAAAVLLRLRK